MKEAPVPDPKPPAAEPVEGFLLSVRPSLFVPVGLIGFFFVNGAWQALTKGAMFGGGFSVGLLLGTVWMLASFGLGFRAWMAQRKYSAGKPRPSNESPADRH